ncbi:unnamed protein product [Urochloa humidicola]
MTGAVPVHHATWLGFLSVGACSIPIHSLQCSEERGGLGSLAMTGAAAFYLLEATAHGAAAGMTTPGAATSAGRRSIPSVHGSSEPGILLAASICEARRPRIGETGSSSIGGRRVQHPQQHASIL